MNQDQHQEDEEDPLIIAQLLEDDARQRVRLAKGSDSEGASPPDLDRALRGLDLIRRAARADQPATHANQYESNRRHDVPAGADTDRLQQAETETQGQVETGKQDAPLICSYDAIAKVLPRRIGRFEIVRELGRGGFGVVFLGRDPELDRMVAIKVPRLEMLVDAEARSRFEREACLVSTLSHPAIVPVYEYSSGPGVPYIAFAWCRGRSLADWLAKNKTGISPSLAARVVSQLAGAVQYAHQRGVVHRDLKPGNILLDVREHADNQEIGEDALVAAVRITDFGLAKSVLAGAPPLTRDGALVGTPSYMAPEQFSGNANVGASVDIYALGAILYELLTGQPPLRRDTDLATMRAVETETPVRPAKIRQDISRDLEAVVLKCLEKSARDRYQTAFELQQDLDNMIAGRSVIARHASVVERLTRWCRRNPAIAALGATTAAGFLVAVAATASGWYTTTRALEREVIARQEADAAYNDAKSAIDQYFVTVSENQLLTAPGLKPLRQELLQSAVTFYTSFIERHRDDDALAWDLTRAFIRRAVVDEELGNLAAARDGFKTALQMLETLRNDNPSDSRMKQQHGTLLRRLAKFDGRDNQLPAAIEKIELAAALHRELLESGYEPAASHGELGLLRREHANLLSSTGKPGESLDMQMESEEHFQQTMILEPDNPRWKHLLATSLGSQAIIHQQLGQPVRAGETLANVAELLKELSDEYPDHLNYQLDWGKALASLSLTQANEGNTEESLNSLTEATKIFDRLASIHPQVVMYQALRCSTRRTAALTLNNLERISECEAMALEAMKILDDVKGEAAVHPAIRQETSQTHSLLGRVYQVQGHREKARHHLNLAIQSLEQDFAANPGNPYTGQSLAEALQQLALVSEGHTQALEHLDRGKSIITTLLEKFPNNPNLSGILRVNEQTRQMLTEQNADD